VKKFLVTIAVFTLAASLARAGDEKERAILDRFLKDVLGPADKLERIERDPPMDQMTKAVTFTRWGEFTASVDSSTGEVVFFSRFKPLLFVTVNDAKGAPRAAADRKAEITRRALYTLDEDAKRAKTFLEEHYPGFKGRKFELTAKERIDRDALVMDELFYVERPAEGIAACWPNRIQLAINPETGSVVTYIGRDHRVESKTKPVIEKQAARKAVLDKYARSISAENRAWLEKEAPIELVAVDGDKGPETAWLVAGRFVVDAEKGTTVRVLGGE
jgi:hypothetical protein